LRTIAIAALLLGVAHAGGEQKPAEPAEPAADATPPRLRLCTGTKGNTYHTAGLMLAKRLAGKVDVEVVETRGSWENLDRIDSEPRKCDAVIAQDDAFVLYQFEKPKSSLTMDRMATLYPEHLHLLCNRKAEVRSAAALDPARHRVLYNLYGSGTYITWSLIGRLAPRYAGLRASEVGVHEGLLKIADGVQAQCMVMVSGFGGETLKQANDRLGDKLELVPLVEKRLHRPVGRDKRPVYSASKIPEGTWPKLADDDVETVAVDAVFFASPEWKARHPEAAKALATGLFELIPELGRLLNRE
jgi:TRAP-type uncharacterized transport system substrate-binding protein